VNNRIYFYPDYGRYVLFTVTVLEHMYEHIQRRLWHKEAGGEIYTIDPAARGLIVASATGPNKGDHRTRHSFNPNIEASKLDRDRQFALGLHAVGLWHTHPEPFPTPSGLDHKATEDYLRGFCGDRDRYFMVILGNSGDTPNMAVWVADQNTRTKWVELVEDHSPCLLTP
jgi:integrative and conjugative element protein (TIGR02256 family)